MLEPKFLYDLLSLFGIGVVSVLISHKLRISPIVGFLIAGILVGPEGFDLISDTEKIKTLADIGVMLLLFSIGIELSLKKLLELGKFLIVAGFFQVFATIFLVSIGARFFGVSWPAAIFLGMLLSLSSTALVLRFMADRGELHSLHGKTSMSLLIFQDLIIVPMILLTPFLARSEVSATHVFETLFQAILFVLGALIAARLVVPWFLHQVVKTRNREAFILTVIVICLTAAWATEEVGLSITLGAFIAGLVISESDYSLQALSEIVPLREIFNSLFFISIGMLFKPSLIVDSPGLLFGGILLVVLLKFLVTAGVTFLHGYSLRVSFLTGLALAQVGEFSFVLAKMGAAYNVLSEKLDEIFLAVAVGTMIWTPVMRLIWPVLAKFMDTRFGVYWSQGRNHQLPEDVSYEGLRDHTIIVGLGPNGQHLKHVLSQVDVNYLVIEMNPETVKKEREQGISIIYGDAGRAEVLKKASVQYARLIVIAIPDPAATQRILTISKSLNPHIHAIVRTPYYYQIKELAQLGADEVVSQEFETSIEIFTRALQRYLVPKDAIEKSIATVRQDRYEMLRSPNTFGTQPLWNDQRMFRNLSMEVIQVSADAKIVSQTLAESELRLKTGVNLVAIQSKDGSLLTNPSEKVTFRSGDIVLVVGEPNQIESAREYLT